MCLIYKTSQDFHDNSVHMYILRLRNYPVETFVNNNYINNRSLIHQKLIDNNSLFDISVYSSAIIPKNLLERSDSSFFARTCLAISSINTFWMSLCIYLCWPGSRWLPYQDMLTEPGHSYSTVWKVLLHCHYSRYLWKLIPDVLENEYTSLLLLALIA